MLIKAAGACHQPAIPLDRTTACCKNHLGPACFASEFGNNRVSTVSDIFKLLPLGTDNTSALLSRLVLHAGRRFCVRFVDAQSEATGTLTRSPFSNASRIPAFEYRKAV